MQLNIAGGSYQDLIIDINNQRCINWFVSPSGQDGAGTALNQISNKVLKQTSGVILLTDCGGTSTRSHITVRNYTYLVVDNKIYKITINSVTLVSTSEVIGTINTSSGYVSVAYSPTEIIWVDGQDGWLYNDDSDIFAQITDGAFPTCNTVVFLGGYFIVEESSTGKFFNSSLNDGSNWDALNFATAETSPDNILALAVTKEELWVLGEKSMEPWFNAGNEPPGSPFSLRTGLSLTTGIRSIYSVINVNDSLFWLDSRGFFVEAGNSSYTRDNNTGYQLNVISTPAITEELKTYNTLSDAIVTSYADKGHIMVQWSFPTDKKTWVWDTLTKQWHENLYYNTTTASYEHSIFQYASEYNERTLVSGLRGGKLYLLSQDYQDNNGILIKRQKTTPFAYIKEGVKLITVVKLTLQVGISRFPVTGDYQTPKVGMKYSTNGGHTWSSILWRKINNYDDLVTWNLLGAARKWIFSFEMSDPVSAALLDAWLDVEVEK